MGTSVGQMILLVMIYYLVVGVGVFCMSFGGLFEDGNLVQGSFNANDPEATAELLNLSIEPTGGFDAVLHTAGAMTDVWKFFRGFGLDLGLGAFGNFLITLIFGWMPALIMGLFIVLAIRSGSS